MTISTRLENPVTAQRELKEMFREAKAGRAANGLPPFDEDLKPKKQPGYSRMQIAFIASVALGLIAAIFYYQKYTK